MNKTLVWIVWVIVGTLGINAMNTPTPIPTSTLAPTISTEQKEKPKTTLTQSGIQNTRKTNTGTVQKTPQVQKTQTGTQTKSSPTKQIVKPATTPVKTVTQPVPTPRQETKKSNCDPNYSGCVPIASDVDCAWGKWNWPAYVRGPVQVIGSDIYDLDRDGDGIGCDK